MTLTRWHKPNLTLDPFEHLSHLRDEVSRLLDSPFERFTSGFNAWAPAIDLYENKEDVIVKAELPGMRKEEIDVSLQDQTLTISGERKTNREDKENETYRSERFSGRFQRSVLLPSSVAVDKVDASYKDGILTVRLPKSEEAKPKQIEVNVS